MVILLIGCSQSEKSKSRDELVRQYYTLLDESNHIEIVKLLTDSLVSREMDYSISFSPEEYVELIKWDAVFEPEYEILELTVKEDAVIAEISKQDRRILFLHEQPIITKEEIKFQDDRISSVAITEYIVFNDSIFSLNRSRLVEWVDQNRPELNGFLTDQTEQGGKNYLEAIRFFKDAN